MSILVPLGNIAKCHILVYDEENVFEGCCMIQMLMLDYNLKMLEE